MKSAEWCWFLSYHTKPNGPCLNCFKAIANAGVTRVVYAVEYRVIEPQSSWARSYGISWEHIGTEKYVPKPIQPVVEPDDNTI